MQRNEDCEGQTSQLADNNIQGTYPESVYSVDPTWEQPLTSSNETNAVWHQTSTTPQNVFAFVPKPVIPGTPDMTYTTGNIKQNKLLMDSARAINEYW